MVMVGTDRKQDKVHGLAVDGMHHAMSKQIKSESRGYHEVKKSKFHAIALPCVSPEQFEQLRAAVSREFADARHIAFAFKICHEQQIQSRVHDAGEPSGTAGRPIFAVLEGSELMNVAIFVIRYFGGVKLGAGGLVRAYSQAAKEAVAAADLAPYQIWRQTTLVIPYNQEKYFLHRFQGFEGQVLEKGFSEDLELRCQVPADRWQEFSSWFEQEALAGRWSVRA